jgi:hypothetical protein
MLRGGGFGVSEIMSSTTPLSRYVAIASRRKQITAKHRQARREATASRAAQRAAKIHKKMFLDHVLRSRAVREFIVR